MASIWSVHMDTQHWGDPEVFRPERFLDDTGKIVNDSWFMPFGVGQYILSKISGVFSIFF